MARTIHISPEALAIFKHVAAGNTLRVPMTYGQAINKRQMLYRIRVAMREQHHHMRSMAERTEITIETGQTPSDPNITSMSDCHLVIRPAGAEFIGLLREAGLDMEEILAEPTDNSPAPNTSEATSALSAIGDYLPKKE